MAATSKPVLKPVPASPLTLHTPTLTPADFAYKWQGVMTKERAAAQEHFLDICRMIGVDSPHDADPTGEWYAFEKGVEKMGARMAGPTSGCATAFEAHPEIAEMDLNPVIVLPDGAVIVDARIRVEAS